MGGTEFAGEKGAEQKKGGSKKEEEPLSGPACVEGVCASVLTKRRGDLYTSGEKKGGGHYSRIASSHLSNGGKKNFSGEGTAGSKGASVRTRNLGDKKATCGYRDGV